MAVQAIPGGLWVPRPLATAAVPAYTSHLVDAADERVAVIIAIPKTGTLDRFEWRTGAVTTWPANGVRCSFQDVSATNGDPDGTQDQFRDVTVSPGANAWVGAGDFPGSGIMTTTGADGGAARSVTRGTLLACVIEAANSADSHSFNVVSVGLGASGADIVGRAYVDHRTTAWAKQSAVMPVMALRYSDGTYEFVGHALPWAAINTVSTFNTGSAPDHRGLRFRFPGPVTVGGCWVRVNAASTGRDFSMLLFDSDGATALETVTVDVDQVQDNTNARLHFFHFPTNRSLSANTTYRLVVRPDTASNISVYDVDVDAAAIMDAIEGGQPFHYTECTNAPANDASWTQTTTKSPQMGLWVTGIDDAVAAGTGGAPIFGGIIVS